MNDFHWGYYLHNSSEGGVKYHVKNLGSGWIAGKTNGVFKSNFLCVLIQIASVPQAKHGQLDQIMRAHDSNLNSMENISCRVWLMTGLRALVQNDIVQCSNPDELEKECFDFGNQFSTAAAENDQPRPVVKSKFCN